jgi:hypothetical protein
MHSNMLCMFCSIPNLEVYQMKYSLPLVVLTLSACGTPGGKTPAEIQRDGAEYRVTADSFMSNTLGVDGCPVGTRPTGTEIDTSTASSISMENGQYVYGAYSAGNRANRCQ